MNGININLTLIDVKSLTIVPLVQSVIKTTMTCS